MTMDRVATLEALLQCVKVRGPDENGKLWLMLILSDDDACGLAVDPDGVAYPVLERFRAKLADAGFR